MIKIIHFGENIKEVICPFYCFTSGVYDNILLVMLTLIPWLRWCLPDFSTVKLVISHFPFSYSICQKQIIQPTLKGRRIKLHLLEGVVLKKL